MRKEAWLVAMPLPVWRSCEESQPWCDAMFAKNRGGEAKVWLNCTVVAWCVTLSSVSPASYLTSPSEPLPRTTASQPTVSTPCTCWLTCSMLSSTLWP